VIKKTYRWIIPVCGVCLLALVLTIHFQGSENSAQLDRNKEGYRLLRLHYDNSSGEKGVTTFEYAQDGLMVRDVFSSNLTRNLREQISTLSMCLILKDVFCARRL
jgi:hypothetical protein